MKNKFRPDQTFPQKLACFGLYICATVMLGGCATKYRDKSLDLPGAPMPAVLIHKSPIMSGYLILSIDGHPRPAGIISRYEIPPGEREVLVGVNEAWYHGDKLRIRFEAKSGETYHLEADSNMKFLSGTWWAWISEDSTGKRFEGQAIQLKNPPKKQAAAAEGAD